ncbi:hypothetical protein GCM10028805_34660 [Spirosoma harenae]
MISSPKPVGWQVESNNSSANCFTIGFFTFFANKPTKGFATNGQVSIWVNGPSDPLELLSLYNQLGDECLHHTNASTSFVLYDSANEFVLTARDLFGVYPLYYTQIGNQLLVSFSVKAIVESPWFTPIANPEMIADYLSWDNITKPITNQTFYQNLYSLLPGHKLVGDKNNLSISAFGQIELDKYASLSDQEYFDKFEDLFVASVQKTSTSHQRIATHLSGGLDSSSVCNVAQSLANEPVHSFYIQTDTLSANEAEYVAATLEQWQHHGESLLHKPVQPDQNVYDSIEKTTSQIAQPSQLLLPVSTFLPIISQAQQAGCRLILSGHAGDQVVGYGFDYLDNLFQKQDWKNLRLALNSYADKRTLYSLNAGKVFRTDDQKRKTYSIHFLAQKLSRTKEIRIWQSALNALFTEFHFSLVDIVYFLIDKLTRTGKKHPPRLTNWIRADWQAAKSTSDVQAIDSQQLVSGTLSPSQKEQIDFIYGRLGIQYNEEIEQIHTQYGMETAHPFLDKNLLELTLNTSDRLRFGDGLGRSVLRQGLKDYLPEKIVNRVDKGEFSDYAHQAFIALYDEFIKQDKPENPVWRIVQREAFVEAVRIIFDERYTIRRRNPYRFLASRVIYLSIWLDYLKTISA